MGFSWLLSFSCGRRGIRKQLVKLEKADSQIVIHDLPEPRKVFMIFAMAESFVSGAELATALRAEGFRVLVRGRFRGFYRWSLRRSLGAAGATRIQYQFINNPVCRFAV